MGNVRKGRGWRGMGKDVSSILNTCFFVYRSLLGFVCTETIMRLKKWSRSEQGTFLPIQTNLYLYLIGWFSGQQHGFYCFFLLGGGGRACRASQNTKDKIKYPTIVLAKPSYNRFIIQLEGYKISSVNVDCSFNENE